MSTMVCPHCSEEIDVFKRGGGETLAQELVLPYLGRIPLDAEVAIRSDSGEPVVLSRPDSAATQAFLSLAENCHKFLNPKETLKAS